MEQFLQTIVNGLTIGSLYCCIAIGFTLIFGIVQLINFAQCEMAMVGAFSFAGVYSVSSHYLPIPATILIAAVTAAICTVFVSCAGYCLLLYPVRKSDKVKGLIVSLGFSIVLQNIVLLWVSSNDTPFPLAVSQRWNWGSITIGGTQVWVIAGALVTWVITWLILYRTRLGRAIRAVAQSPDGALLMGIPVNKVVIMTFGLAAVTATVAGILMAMYNGMMRFDMGFLPGIKGFIVAILGGVGNLKGALVAGLMFGLMEGFFAGYLSSDYRDVFAFSLLIIILLVRPHGLLGEGA
jgi:branched-chain amino acid transport system permease protein